MEESFGVIPVRQSGEGWSVFLIQHRKGRYWGFPKGHAEPGETPEQSATRELLEETNLTIIRFLSIDPIKEEYTFLLRGKRVFKRVVYYVAEVGGDVSLQMEEIADGMWVPFPEALKKPTHPEGRAILQQVYEKLEGDDT